MTEPGSLPRGRRLAVVGRRPASAAERAGVDGPLPFAGARSLVVSAAAIRSALAAWAAAERRDDAELVAWPQALLVAMALAESGRSVLGVPSDVAPWELEITIAPASRDLTRRTALPARAVRRTVDVLVSAEILDSVRRLGDLQVVRFRPTAFEDAPVAGQVVWESVRARLGVTLSAAALLTVRELACRTSPEDRARGQFVPATLRDLEDATGYGKSAVRSALTALGASALVESRVRPRMDSWHRLLPAAFEAAEASAGDTGSVPPFRVAVEAAGRASGPPQRAPDARAATRRVAAAEPARAMAPAPVGSAQGSAAAASGAGDQTDAARAPSDWAIVEINGVRFPVPAGVHPVPERDASGDWYLRVGPGLRYGPLRFFA